MGLLDPKSPSDVIISAFAFDIRKLDCEDHVNDIVLPAAERIFAMVASIINMVGGKLCQEQEIIERDIGNGVKALCRETYVNTCLIEPGIKIHHHNRTEHGLGGCEHEENVAWIIAGGQEIFRAQWGWNSLDKKSLFISLTPEARQTYALIYQKWEQLATNYTDR